jgi:hypothetical protein
MASAAQPPSLHRVYGHETEGEITKMFGDKEKQKQTAGEANSPRNQPTKQHSVSVSDLRQDAFAVDR